MGSFTGSLSPGQPQGSVPGTHLTWQKRHLAQVHSGFVSDALGGGKLQKMCVLQGWEVLRDFYLLAP